MEPLLLLAVLACPVGMGLMMWFMARGDRSNRNEAHAPADAQSGGEPTLAELKAEQARLDAEIEQLEGRAWGAEPVGTIQRPER